MKRCRCAEASAPVVFLTMVIALVVMSASGCGGGARTDEIVVTDSAGVEIVTNPAAAPAWKLSPEPVLSLGVVDQEGPTQFFRVSDVELLPDGGVAVANSGSEEVRLFSSDGRYLGSFGGSGSGPREFRGLSMLEERADSIATYDGGNDRISMWLVDGTLSRSFRLEWVSGLLMPVAFLGDGGVLAITARYMSELPGPGLVVDTALVSHYSPDGFLVDSLLRLPHNERVVMRDGDLQTTLGAPFSAFAQIVAQSDNFCYAFGVPPEIRCYDLTGQLSRIIRVQLPPRPVTEAYIAGFWEDRFADPSGPRRDAYRRMQRTMPFPAFFPSFSQLLSDEEGRLWARVYPVPDATEERWLVFDAGRVVRQLSCSPGFRVMDVEGPLVAGVREDDFGVELVEVYRISDWGEEL